MDNQYRELLAKIDARIKEISYELSNDNNIRVEYLSEFFETCNLKDMSTIFGISNSSLLFALLLEADRKTDFNELEDMIIEVKDYIDHMSVDELVDICDVYMTVETREALKEIEKNMARLLQASDNSSILGVALSNIVLGIKIKDINESLNLNISDYEEFLLFMKVLKILEKIDKNKNINLLVGIACFHEEREKTANFLNAFELRENLSDNEKEERLNKIVSKTVNQKTVEKSLHNLYSYYIEIEKQEKSKNRIRNKKIYRYVELKESLEKESKKKEITNIDSILDKILDDDIKKLCLEYIFSHNEKYYQELYQEYAYKSENPIKKYITYFNTLGIDFLEIGEENQKQIMTFSIETLKHEIGKLPQISFHKDILISICKKKSLTVIEEINKLIKNNYIDLNLLLSNQNIYVDDDVFKNLKENIKMLEHRKINIRELENKQILLVPNELLLCNLELLEKLGISLKGLKKLDMLAKPCLIEEISLLVEVGLENSILKQPNILNSDKKLAKRILISQMVDENIYDDNGDIKDSILDKDSFFLQDNEVESYLFDRDNSRYHSNFKIVVEDDSKSLFSYDIEGIKIPKLKVKNLSISLEELVHNSMYSKEEIKILEKHSKNK